MKLPHPFARRVEAEPPPRRDGAVRSPGSPSVLNVGGNNKSIPIPDHYAGWEHLLLDISPDFAPDILCDARDLDCLEPERFDAVYCSHNLEHFYKHDVPRVLRGFLHVLKPGGFAEIFVPDLAALFRKVVEDNLDVEDTLYLSPAGPITVGDVIYGYAKEIEESGEDFFAHKTGFTPASLEASLTAAGFRRVYMVLDPDHLQVGALAFKGEPSPDQRARLRLPG